LNFPTTCGASSTLNSASGKGRVGISGREARPRHPNLLCRSLALLFAKKVLEELFPSFQHDGLDLASTDAYGLSSVGKPPRRPGFYASVAVLFPFLETSTLFLRTFPSPTRAFWPDTRAYSPDDALPFMLCIPVPLTFSIKKRKRFSHPLSSLDRCILFPAPSGTPLFPPRRFLFRRLGVRLFLK